MNQKFEDVQKFCQLLGLDRPIIPRMLTEPEMNRQIRLIENNFDDFVEAYEADNLTDMCGAIANLLYVVFETAVRMYVIVPRTLFGK